MCTSLFFVIHNDTQTICQNRQPKSARAAHLMYMLMQLHYLATAQELSEVAYFARFALSFGPFAQLLACKTTITCASRPAKGQMTLTISSGIPEMSPLDLHFSKSTSNEDLSGRILTLTSKIWTRESLHPPESNHFGGPQAPGDTTAKMLRN